MSTTITDEHFAIGELAQELDITTRTIRYYEERGLLSPQRTDGGQRAYSRRERGRLKLILRAKAAGFDLEEVRDVLEIYDTKPNQEGMREQALKLIGMTERRLTEVDEKIAELIELREGLATHLDTLHEMTNNGRS
jgi:DNA-binding transcriptional MerR regulator